MATKRPQTDQEKLKILSQAMEKIFYAALDADKDPPERVVVCSGEAALAMLRIGKPELYKVLHIQWELPFYIPAAAQTPEFET